MSQHSTRFGYSSFYGGKGRGKEGWENRARELDGGMRGGREGRLIFFSAREESTAEQKLPSYAIVTGLKILVREC